MLMRFLSVFLAMFVFVGGCEFDSVFTTVAPVSVPDAEISAPTDVVWAAMKAKADEQMRWMRLWRTLTYDDLASGTPAQLEKAQRDIEWKLGGVAIEDYDIHALQRAFYTKYLDAGGIAIVVNDDVTDARLYEA